MKTLLLVTTLLLITGSAVADTKEPLTIKGVALGDSMEKGSQVGICDYFRGGICVGKTTFGPVPNAGFSVFYIGGKVSSIMVHFEPRYSKEIFAGLTSKYGESTPTGCKPGEVCHTWKSGGVSLVMVESVGAVTLNRATPEGGY
jgi:hypothetical protein